MFFGNLPRVFTPTALSSLAERSLCYAECATVEERPFQGRVRKWMRTRALAPVVVFLCGAENDSRGAKAP